MADFSRSLAWGVFAAFVAAGVLLGWLRRSELKSEMLVRRGQWLATEAVFLGVFAFFLLLRAWNPDLWYHPTGGEKPMEVAYLTAVVRSTELPPYDPWFAGGYLNYYYMGWFFLAVPIRALQLVPEVAFNLAVPTFASISAAVAFCTGNNLVRLSRLTAGSFTARRGVLGGLVASMLLVFAGNLDAAHQTIERVQRISESHPKTGFPPFDGTATLVGGAWRWLTTSQPLAPFDWWRSSRVHFGTSDITEFPYWTFLFGDVHPHLMGIPFFGSVALVALVYVGTAAMGDWRRTTLLAALLGVLLAMVRMVHTWDFPTAAAIIGGAVVIGQVMAPGTRRRRMVISAGHLVLAAGTAQLIVTPYLAHSAVFNQGFVRSATTTPPQQFLTHFGIFMAIAAAFVAVRYFEEIREDNRNGLVAFFRQPEWLLASGTLTICLALFANEHGYMVVALASIGLVVIGNLLWIELRRDRPSVGEAVATGLLFAGLLVAAAVDLLTVKDDIGRMNTVFKFSLQAWHMLALGSSFAALYVVSFLKRTSLPSPVRRSQAILRGTTTRAVLGVVVLGALFPLMATPERQEQRFGQFSPTLDGLRYLDSDPTYTEDIGRPGPDDDVPLHLREDEPLIRWLRENVKGSPTIVEAVGPLYHWTGRYSINTGLPAVIGWDWHQIQQRGKFGSQIGQRREEVRDFYVQPDTREAERFLRRYDVSYVVVGPWERAFGTAEGVAKLEQMQSLKRVFSSGPNAIYEVDKQALGHGVD
jgi:YYY domain-containing protein